MAPVQPSSIWRNRRSVWFKRESSDHYARWLNSLDELEPPLRDALVGSVEPDEEIYCLLYAPFQGVLKKYKTERKWFDVFLAWEFTPDWIVMLTSRRLIIARLEEAGKLPEINKIPFEQIFWMQTGVILLFSWFQINWVANGMERQETIYYNSVCESLFEDLSTRLRLKISEITNRLPCSPEQPGSQHANKQALAGLPYKFMNMIPLHLLLPDEQVIQAAYRPAIWRRRLRVFRHMVAPRATVVRTQSHLLLAEEELTGQEGSYGLISTFLPLSRVADVVLDPTGRLVISLALGGARREFSLSAPAESTGSFRLLTA